MASKTKKDDTDGVAPANEVVGTPIRVGDIIVTAATNTLGDEGALSGSFVKVIDGDYAGSRGVFDSVASADSDGAPIDIVVLMDDDSAERVVVPYASVRPLGQRR